MIELEKFPKRVPRYVQRAFQCSNRLSFGESDEESNGEREDDDEREFASRYL